MAQISIFGVHPNIMILFTALVGSLLGSKKGSIVGFFAGLAKDIFTVNIFGVSILTYTLVGFFTGRIKESSTTIGTKTLYVLSGAFGTMLGTILYILFISMIGPNYLFSIHSYIITIVITIFNAILAIPLASFLRHFINIDAFDNTWTL